MQLSQTILTYIEDHREEAFLLLVQLAQIPAPSNHEEKRAAFCKSWLDAQGAKGVFIDEALNVVYPIGCFEDNPVVVFMAHSDVVFPDTEPLPLVIEEGLIRCPGIGDDTANMVALLMAAKYIAEHHLTPECYGIVLVINSGEEGLGNLKGSRKVMETFGSRVKEFISFDSKNCNSVNRAVGSKRYRIEIDTEGGHSYNDFGNRSAIAYLGSMIDTLYAKEVPKKGKTTYNVGFIKGGTSVNTIAQHAEMLYEFRSDERDSLAVMEQYLNETVEAYRAKGLSVTVTLVGDRPCGGQVDPAGQASLMERAASAFSRHYGLDLTFVPGSTDCNIPLSLGIPAVCVGCCLGDKAHTREEYVEIHSLLPGLKVCYDLVLHYFCDSLA